MWEPLLHATLPFDWILTLGKRRREWSKSSNSDPDTMETRPQGDSWPDWVWELITITTKLDKHLELCFGEVGGHKNEWMKKGKEAEMMETSNPIRNLLSLAHFEFLGVQPRSLTEWYFHLMLRTEELENDKQDSTDVGFPGYGLIFIPNLWMWPQLGWLDTRFKASFWIMDK